MICGAIRSSSWAHTDAEHATVRTPARSAVGLRLGGDRGADRAGQARCTSASTVSGRELVAQRARARTQAPGARGGSASAHAASRARVSTDRRAGDREPVDVGPVGAGDLLERRWR